MKIFDTNSPYTLNISAYFFLNVLITCIDPA